jgi:hypothetical protein
MLFVARSDAPEMFDLIKEANRVSPSLVLAMDIGHLASEHSHFTQLMTNLRCGDLFQ